MTVLSALVLKALFRPTAAPPGEVGRQRSEAQETQPRRRSAASNGPKAGATRRAAASSTRADSRQPTT